MRKKRIGLTTKKSFYQTYGLEIQEPHFLSCIKRNSEFAHRLLQEHEENLRISAEVEEFLHQHEMQVDKNPHLTSAIGNNYDLFITVGGDGTLLSISHWLEKTPVLGINSRPGYSVGHFCKAHGGNFRPFLESILDNKVSPVELMRMDVIINGKVQNWPVLNDILYSCANPAATVTYKIKLDDKEELQKSSGIWIATPAGSTAAIFSAGGKQMELNDIRLQFLVRELCRTWSGSRRYRLKHGFFRAGFSVTNLSPEAALYLDGSRIVIRLFCGDVFEVRPSHRNLRIYL